jgi:lipopolysaccharide export system permease protein
VAGLTGTRAVRRAEGGRAWRPGLFDGYLLTLLARPLAAALLVVLPALLLERMLRLFDLVAAQGRGVGAIALMLLNLVPHYLGLAMPAAFFAAICLVVARLAEDSEFDAMQAAGLSLARITRPFFAVAVLLGLFGLALYGWMQPHGRYAYRAIQHALVEAGWNAVLPARTFVPVADRVVAYADRAGPDGRTVEGVFVRFVQADGTDVVVMGEAGWFRLSEDAARLELVLDRGERVEVAPDGRVRVVRFGRATDIREVAFAAPPFRPRGADERELTLAELWAGAAPDGVSAARAASELHARLARSAALLLLPLLAVPIGLGAKRTRRWQGLALGAVLLVVFHHAMQFGESMADLSRIDPRAAAWGPAGAFAALSLGLFARALRDPSRGPFDAAFGAADAVAARLARPWRRRTA